VAWTSTIKLESPTVDYYRLLSVPRNASIAEIKLAYHRALLIHHPDKQPFMTARPYLSSVDIASIKDAYTTLSSPHLRALYDAQLKDQSMPAGPRPAQVISLEEFEEGDECVSWCYECRCGGYYKISEEDLEKGRHLVGCGSCSEVIWVGYELAEPSE
jgi:diphthamide biosynthesis protein 4